MRLDHLRRRDFMVLLGGAAGWPLTAAGQQPVMPVIGLLRTTPAAPFAHLVAALREGLGELGLVAPGGARTRSVECVAAGEILEVRYDQVRQLYFQNPAFGFAFLELAARRLFDTIARQEAAAAPPPVDLARRGAQP